MQPVVRRSRRALRFVFCVVVTSCAVGLFRPHSSQAQNFTSNVTVTTGDTPLLRLDQNGSSGFTPRAWDVAGNESNFFVRDVTGGNTLPLRIFPGAPSDSVTISGTTGRVGLRTGAPTANLHVFGGAATDVFVGMGSIPGGASPNCAMNLGYAGASLGQGKGFINVRPCVGGTPDLRFLVANTAKLIVDSAGINVLGSIRSNGTSLNVPDYVFEPEYKLRPLSEVAVYVAEEKHLPDIPSAQQIKEHGLDMGAMQMHLLRKVEELTLYTITQDQQLIAQTKKLATQDEQLALLQATNAALSRRLLALERRLKARGR